jgi:hypothetical protein
MADNVWVRIRHHNDDKMIRYSDIEKSELFKRLSEIHSSNDIEMRRRVETEYNSGMNVLLLNYPNVDYDHKLFEALEKRPPQCSFDAYVSFKDVLVGRDYDLD